MDSSKATVPGPCQLLPDESRFARGDSKMGCWRVWASPTASGFCRYDGFRVEGNKTPRYILPLQVSRDLSRVSSEFLLLAFQSLARGSPGWPGENPGAEFLRKQKIRAAFGEGLECSNPLCCRSLPFVV